MRFALISLGCKVNRVESDSIASALLAAGHERCGLQDAQCVVINTCTVTGEAEKKARKAVRRALRENGAAPVYVTGCAVAIDKEAYGSLSPRVVAEADKGKVIEEIKGRFPQVGPSGRGGRALRIGEGFPTRAGIKVQDGCNNACSYCIVNKARGKAWSKDADEVEEEVLAYARGGVKEIVLTGINLGSYAWKGYGLAQLLERLLEATEGIRLRVSSIEPCDVDEGLIALIAQGQGRICRHLHLPLQSGSSKVLGEMCRPYGAPAFLSLVERLYREIPGLSLSTDVIVGFPGETDDDFEETLEAVRRCRFSKAHVFPYSKRAGTAAALRPDQVPPEVKAARVARLTALCEGLRKADFEGRCGSQELVLVEKEGYGLTESYYHVHVPLDGAAGSLIPLTLGLSATGRAGKWPASA